MAQLKGAKLRQLVHRIRDQPDRDAVLQAQVGQLTVCGGRHSFESHHFLPVCVPVQYSQCVSRINIEENT
jgi:hypothetical protein